MSPGSFSPIDVSEPDDYLRTFCSYSAPSLCFPPSLVSYPSFYVSQAAVPNWLSQHLPAVHHGEHTADHPQRLHYFPADASHPPARHGPRPVAKGTACWHPVPCWSSRYDPWRVAPSLQCHDAWEYVCLCVCLWVAASVVCSLCSCEVVATFSDAQKQMTRSNFSDLPFHTRALNYLGCKSICYQIIFIQILHLLSGCPSKVDHNSIHTCSPVPFFKQSVFWITCSWRWWVKFTQCIFIQKLMNWFLLFNDGPLLLSVKGIIDLAQMPPTILLPHPGGTGTPTLERIAYLPGAQPPFPPRAFNPTSISPGEDPSLPHSYSFVPLVSPAMTCIRETPLSDCSCALPWNVKGQFCPSSPSAKSFCDHNRRIFHCIIQPLSRIIFCFICWNLIAVFFMFKLHSMCMYSYLYFLLSCIDLFFNIYNSESYKRNFVFYREVGFKVYL